MNKSVFIAVFAILLVLPLASSAPPFISSSITTSGLLITAPNLDIIKQGNNNTFYWYVENQTSGAFLNNTIISCSLEIYRGSQNGIPIANMPATFDGIQEFSVFIDKNNFSAIGDYVKRIKCNSTLNTGIGGILTLPMTVTKNGFNSELQNFLPLIFSIGAIIVILIVLAIILHKEHGILALLFAGIGFYMLVPLLNTANISLENAYFDSGLSGMISSITSILTWMDYALIIYIIVYIFIKVVSGYNQDKQMKIEGLK